MLYTRNNAFFPVYDFTRNNEFCDDPRLSHSSGGLSGPDGKPLRLLSVEDGVVRHGIMDSVLSHVRFSLDTANSFVNATHVCSAAMSVCNNANGNECTQSAFANDSGTEFTLMTLSTGSQWDGKAMAVLNVIGAGGLPFKAYGGDDLIVCICDVDGVWRIVLSGR